MHTQFLGLAGEIGRAVELHQRVDAFDLQVAGVGHAVHDGHVALDRVKRKALCKHIPEIEQQTPGQGLQTQHAQQLGNPGVGFEELAAAHAHIQVAVQAGVMQVER